MSEYHRQNVELLIPKDSDLYRKISARAVRDGVSVESVVEMLMLLGAHVELEQKLEMMDRMDERRSKRGGKR